MEIALQTITQSAYVGKTFKGRTYFRRPIEERLAERVNFLGPVPAHAPHLGSCWVATKGIDVNGYAKICRGGRRGKTDGMHRVSYELHFGSIPDSLVIDHLCKNRSCCNPVHLRAVTNGENVMCGDGPCAQNAKKTHCKHGHRFTPQNTIVQGPSKSHPYGARACRACAKRRRDTKNTKSKKNRAVVI